MEDKDVLEASKSTLENLAESANKILAQAGLPGTQGRKYLSKAAKFGLGLFSGTRKSTNTAIWATQISTSSWSRLDISTSACSTL